MILLRADRVGEECRCCLLAMIWAEDHHVVEVVDESGQRLARRRFPEGVAGMAGLHALIADHLSEDCEASDVVVGIETDRGPWVTALIAAGYQVYAVNPMQASRYRERYSTSGAKSDRGDAHVLAELRGLLNISCKAG